MTSEPPYVDWEIRTHYDEGNEHKRLLSGPGRLELLRTQETIEKYAPPAPGRALDVGGGPGIYAGWLAGLGYDVHLVDPIPLHVEQAAKAAAELQAGMFTVELGDARHLHFEDNAVDLVLLLGPLYHLTERSERMAALAEARRVLRPGGVLVAAGISQFASLHDGLAHGWLSDGRFGTIVERTLTEGQHRNPEREPGWFTTAYFHHPDILAAEMRESGFVLEGVLGVEGAAWLLPDLDAQLADERRRRVLLDGLRRVEREPSLVGVSSHLLAVGRARR
ncbi:MAG: class I SAM-dependent methyltransferase [Actinomycetota bacterium]|nr:class I SAM-dependent methyltransferase [Actinomycetota bacterium]